MTIFGIGTDLLETQRIEKAYRQHGQRLVEKLLAKEEIQDFEQSRCHVNFLAKRWAAKEAIGKALGTGIATPFIFPNIIIGKTPLGQPIVTFSPKCKVWLTENRVGTCHLSISDEISHILAFSVIEKCPEQ